MAVFHGTTQELDAEKRRIAQNQAAQMQNATRLRYVQRLMNPDLHYDSRGSIVGSVGGDFAMPTPSPDARHETLYPERFKRRNTPEQERAFKEWANKPNPKLRIAVFLLVFTVLAVAYTLVWPSPVMIACAGIVAAVVSTYFYTRFVQLGRNAESEPPDTTEEDLLKYHYRELADFDEKLRAATMIGNVFCNGATLKNEEGFNERHEG